MHANLAATLANLTEEQARVVWAAMGQFVENTRDSVDSGDNAETEAHDLELAEAVLEKMDAAMAALVA